MIRLNTSALLVETMSACLQEHGYRSTSTTQILAKSGVARASLYFHFPGGKEALAAAAVAASGCGISGWITAEFAAGPSAASVAGRLVDGFAAILATSQYTKGCPVALSALEAGENEPLLRAAVQAVYADWQQVISDGLVADGLDADTAARLAQLALIQIEGALLLARVTKSLEPLMATKAAIIAAIGGAL